jgi:hypothetical protein
MPTGNAASRYLENAMAAQMPQLRQQQEGMRKYLQGKGQRIGAKGAGAQARQAVDVYATQAGNVSARLGADAERMGQQQEQFETQAATQKEQFESQMAQRDKQQNLSNMMAMFPQTGWTPELLEAMGLGESAAGTPGFERQISDLGFAGPEGKAQNPASSGPFGRNNEMLYRRAQMPGSQFSNKAQRNQQAWLQSQFG